MESPYAPLSESCAKTLCDKTYEKRKLAASEIEKYVLRDFFFINNINLSTRKKKFQNGH